MKQLTIIIFLIIAEIGYAQVPKDLYGTWEVTTINGKKNTKDYFNYKFAPIRDMNIGLNVPKKGIDINLSTYGLFTCAGIKMDELQGFYDFYGRNGFSFYTYHGPYSQDVEVSIIVIKEWLDNKIVAEFDVSEYGSEKHVYTTRVLERRPNEFYPSYRIDLWVEQSESGALYKRDLAVRPPGPISSYTMFDVKKENDNYFSDLKNLYLKKAADLKKFFDSSVTIECDLKKYKIFVKNYNERFELEGSYTLGDNFLYGEGSDIYNRAGNRVVKDLGYSSYRLFFEEENLRTQSTFFEDGTSDHFGDGNGNVYLFSITNNINPKTTFIYKPKNLDISGPQMIFYSFAEDLKKLYQSSNFNVTHYRGQRFMVFQYYFIDEGYYFIIIDLKTGLSSPSITSGQLKKYFKKLQTEENLKK